MAATNKKSNKLKEPVRVRTKKLADGSESYYLDIYVNGKRSYEFLKMYHLAEAAVWQVPDALSLQAPSALATPRPLLSAEVHEHYPAKRGSAMFYGLPRQIR